MAISRSENMRRIRSQLGLTRVDPMAELEA